MTFLAFLKNLCWFSVYIRFPLSEQWTENTCFCWEKAQGHNTARTARACLRWCCVNSCYLTCPFQWVMCGFSMSVNLGTKESWTTFQFYFWLRRIFFSGLIKSYTKTHTHVRFLDLYFRKCGIYSLPSCCPHLTWRSCSYTFSVECHQPWSVSPQFIPSFPLVVIYTVSLCTYQNTQYILINIISCTGTLVFSQG